MTNPVLRLILKGALFALAVGLVIFIAGYVLGWRSFIDFSNACFWAGLLFFAAGFVHFIGNIYQDDDPRMQYSQTSVPVTRDERRRIVQTDLARSHAFLIFMGTAGLILFGLSRMALLVAKLSAG
jgi:hypothetical protein